ncbi:M28 family peptidase [Dysgonomonas sp. 520]|uniref:M28 family peptidase n=1 Tax=Dysgonomonas sp. 520 TaxID=2302931 RepID=UPI0013D3E88F|nr:M28 family peptidase [Dysgonomonas sp. 520]NDW08412.1 glutamine cyclotransferase [Dysgonomonas sp. 520]
MKKLNLIFVIGAMCLIGCSCGSKTSKTDAPKVNYEKVSPDFNADSAYAYVDKQVGFGPRVPNTEQHVACGDYLVSMLKGFGAEVTEQKADVKAFDGTILKMRNIIGSYSPEKRDRILLFAHWDTRPFADNESDKNKRHTHILGANDGGSGVGVLLEIARQIQVKQPGLGIDIIFFDAEDYGAPDFADNVPDGDWWCLGSQYWSKNPHKTNYKARFGILLDMVGGANATFYKEAYSQNYARDAVSKIWNTAKQLGYANYFVDKQGGAIMDDHVPVIQNLKIPCVDIIQLDPNTSSGFAGYWHTVNDDMSNVSKETLKAVGQTVMEVIYKEQ